MNPDTLKSSVNQAPNRRMAYVGGISELLAVRSSVAFELASGRMADIIGVHDFDKRERLILDFVRWYSFGANRTEAEFPRLDFFVKAIGTSRGNVSGLLKGLKAKLVIEELPAGFYGFCLPWQNWKVARRFDGVELVRQLELFERPPGLGPALREVFVEQYGATPDGADARQSNGRPVSSEHSGVPESGTPEVAINSCERVIHNQSFPNRELSGTAREFRNRERRESIGKIDVPEGVPESGTAPLVISSGSTVKQYCLRGKEAGKGKRFNEVEQSRWDRMMALCCAGGKEAFRNVQDRNFFIAFVRRNGRVFEDLLNALGERMKPHEARMHGPVECGAAWLRNEWREWGRPGDWH